MMTPGRFRGAWVVREADGVVREAGVFATKFGAQQYCDQMNRMLQAAVDQSRQLTANDQVLLKDNGSEPTPRR